jgi:hypothetical protein
MTLPIPAGDAVAALNAQAIAMGWSVRCYEDLDFFQPELNGLSDVWSGKAHKTRWPGRADFDARTLQRFLPHVCLAERVESDAGGTRYRNRIFGSALVRFFGEQTGRHLDELLPEPHLERWTAIYDTVLACSRPLRIASRFEWRQVSWLDGEMFATSLSNGDAPPTMILSAMYMTPKAELLMDTG